MMGLLILTVLWIFWMAVTEKVIAGAARIIRKRR